MVSAFKKFQSITRNAQAYSLPSEQLLDLERMHPFEERNVHPNIDKITRRLFDDGHYSSATFEAFKFVDKKVQKISRLTKSGYQLMMAAFSETEPLIKLNDLNTMSEIDEQKGYKFLFSGAVMAIRNPRGHEVLISETPDQCLDHISLASLLLRRLNQLK